jgi:hypothetical protein
VGAVYVKTSPVVVESGNLLSLADRSPVWWQVISVAGFDRLKYQAVVSHFAHFDIIAGRNVHVRETVSRQSYHCRVALLERAAVYCH